MKVKNKNRSSLKTKQKIREAFAELLKEKNELSNMTVTELVKLADITRSTFYTHYDSIYDVAKDLQDETLELISIYDKDIRSINDLDKYIDRVIKNLKDNEDMYRTLLRSREPLLFIEKLSNMINKRLIDFNMFVETNYSDLIVTFFTYGCVNLFVRYFMGDLKCSLDDIGEFIKGMVKELLTSKSINYKIQKIY